MLNHALLRLLHVRRHREWLLFTKQEIRQQKVNQLWLVLKISRRDGGARYLFRPQRF